jgi:GMP synthase-like glutamine amidotransferase
MKPVLIRRHGMNAPPALLGEWCAERGITYVVSHSWHGGPGGRVPDPRDYAFIASLGSKLNPRDTHEPVVVEELQLMRDAIAADVPVLGLCFGGQMLSAALGGETVRAEAPELGWVTIESDDEDLVPTGPWLEWHFDRFTVPDGATVIARNAHCTQAFVHGPHLGTQFHPESTIEVVAGWARNDAERLRSLGIEDGESRLDVPEERKRQARDAAFRLFDAFAARRQR